MRIDDILKRWAWLLEKLKDQPGLTREQIMEDWQKSLISEEGALTYSKSTFFYDIERLANLCGLVIKAETKCTASGYYIHDIKGFPYTVSRWIMNVLHTDLVILRFKHLYRRIIIDDFPSDAGILEAILKAMEKNRKVRILYQRFGGDESEYTIEPYCIKTYKRRYYVLGHCDSGRFRIFSLDRINDVTILQEEFIMDECFDAREFFNNFYGVFITTDDKEPTEITIRAHDDAKYYLQSVPLHHTQRLVCEGNGFADFCINIFPTKDFIGDILQQAGRLEIIAPKSVQLMYKEQASPVVKQVTSID